MEEKPHKELEVWRKAVDLVVAGYQVTSRFPTEERIGLTAQVHRAAMSIPSNIAEGAARGSSRGFVNLRLAEIARMLNGLIASVRRKTLAALECISILLGLLA